MVKYPPPEWTAEMEMHNLGHERSNSVKLGSFQARQAP